MKKKKEDNDDLKKNPMVWSSVGCAIIFLIVRFSYGGIGGAILGIIIGGIS